LLAASGLLASRSMLAEPHLFGEARACGGVFRRHHGIIAAETPLLAILLWCEVVIGAQVSLERRLSAKDAGALTIAQTAVAKKCETLVRAFSRVGVIALVDEATGYQEVRPRDELRRLLEAYVSPEFLPWTKRFPDEFYKELFRLRGWQYDPLSVKRPKLVGLLTESIVYKRLPEGVLVELKKLNPKDESGRRKRRHHQFLTDDIGNPHLEKHVASAITLMKIFPSYKSFKKYLDKALPVPKSQLSLPFPDEDETAN
jgi:P63C domain